MTRGLADVLLLNSAARLLPGCLQVLRDAIRSGADLATPMLVSALGQPRRPVSYYQIDRTGHAARASWGAALHDRGLCFAVSRYC